MGSSKSRLKKQAGKFSKVDGIPFNMPVNSIDSPVVMAGFYCNYEKAKQLLPGSEVHPFKLWNGKALLVITVVNYINTTIGKYIEYSIAIACTHGAKPAPRMIPLMFPKSFGVGQYILDLPVSTEISVKGGKGIWGMPKHQASLDFLVDEKTVSCQYDLDGQMIMRLDVDRPKAILPISAGASNYCQYRGMLMKSNIFFHGKMGFKLFKKGSAKITLGDHPKADKLKALEIAEDPMFTMFFPKTSGFLDDYFECWFLTNNKMPEIKPEGMESTINLGLGQEWLPGPNREKSKSKLKEQLI
jgi:hypothetical protein